MKKIKRSTLFSLGSRRKTQRRKRRKTVFDRAGFSKDNYDVTALILAVIVAVSSDASTKVRCDSALKSLRKLRRIVG
jgi:hypothetical protein